MSDVPPSAKRYPLPEGGRLAIARHTSADGGTTLTRFARTRNALEKNGDRVGAYRDNDTGEVHLTYCRGKRGTPAYVTHATATFDGTFDDLDLEAWALEHLTRCGPVVAWCRHCGRPMQAGDLMCCPRSDAVS